MSVENVRQAVRMLRDRQHEALVNYGDRITESDHLSAQVTVEGLNALERDAKELDAELNEYAEKLYGWLSRMEGATDRYEDHQDVRHQTGFTLGEAARWLVYCMDHGEDDEDAAMAVKEALVREGRVTT